MIADTFIKRPVTAIVVSLVLVLVGILALLNLPVSQYPDITPPTVQVTGSFIGADAQTVEQTVTTPIETQVNGTPGMAYIQSNSTNNGQSTQSIQLIDASDSKLLDQVEIPKSFYQPWEPDEQLALPSRFFAWVEMKRHK